MDINLKNETSTLKMIDKHSVIDSTDNNDEKAPQSGICLTTHHGQQSGQPTADVTSTLELETPNKMNHGTPTFD